MGNKTIELDDRAWSIEDLLAVADSDVGLTLSADPTWRARIESSATHLAKRLASGDIVYGVNTGFGESCDVRIPDDLVHELPLHLTRFHGCGLGKPLDDQAARAVMIARAITLAKGYSGVRMELLEQLLALIQHDIIPIIPEEGSVGASGDLTPLSYVAAAMVGERNVRYGGETIAASDALQRIGRAPLVLQPKEGLALMNGTSVMTALAALAFQRADYLLRLSCHITALGIEALMGNRTHYRPELFVLKPHPGQARVAQRIYELLHLSREAAPEYRLQDRYSFRCAPHVIGVLADAAPSMRAFIETELNSVDDNPLIDGENEEILHGGHFYGGHIAFAMDGMKNAVANIGDLLDRQVALVTDRKSNNNLPANLSGAEGDRAQINHGFKALQISISAWTAEALKLTMPASAFSRSTECHNQDKVSMGTIAARDALRVIELCEQVAAAALLIMQQGVLIRLKRGEVQRDALQPALAAFAEDIGTTFSFLDEDRPLEQDLKNILAKIRSRYWDIE